MTTFQIKKDSTDPVLAVQFVDSNGSAVSLSNGSNIFFKLSTNDNQFTSVFSGNATITGSATGEVEYRWSTANTNRSGLYLGEFTTLFKDDSVLTLPSDNSLVIKINKDYDGS